MGSNLSSATSASTASAASAVQKDQFASRVVAFSSQYGYHSANTRAYKAQNLAGPPSKYPGYGDDAGCLVTRRYGRWWMEAPSGKVFLDSYDAGGAPSRQVDFVDFEVDVAVAPRTMELFETLNPGSVVRIWGLEERGGGDRSAWHLLYRQPEGEEGHNLRVSRCHPVSLRCPSTRTLFRIFRLEMDQTDMEYYSELDAVRVRGVDQYWVGPMEASAPLEAETSKVVALWDQNDGICYLEALPEEILCDNILSRLSLPEAVVLASTSRTMLERASKSNKLRKVDMKKAWHAATPSLLRGVSSLGAAGRLKWLDLSWCGLHLGAEWRDELHNLIEVLCQSGCPLTRLRLNNSHCLLATLALAFRNFPLEELSLEATKVHSIHHSGEQFLDDYLATLPSLPATVRCLNVATSGITEPTLSRIWTEDLRGAGLAHVDVSNCRHLDLGTALWNAKLSGEGARMSLSSLQAWRCNGTKSTSFFSRESVMLALQALPAFVNLEELDLGWSLNGLTGDELNLQQLLVGLPKLKKLFLSHFMNLRPEDPSSIGQCCPLLEQLDLVSCPFHSRERTEPLKEMFAKLKHLRHVDLSFSNIDRKVLTDLAKKYPNVQICCCDVVDF